MRITRGPQIVWNHVGHPGPGRVEGVEMADYELAMDLNIRSVLVTTAEAAVRAVVASADVEFEIWVFTVGAGER